MEKNQQSLKNSELTQDYSKKFISVYRINLVKDESVKFEQKYLNSPLDAKKILQHLIKSHGNSDREQFCVLLLNCKNKMLGLNIVSTGSLSSASVHPREVLKPAILANASAMVLCHNHPSGNTEPSAEDRAITKRIILASSFLGVTIHDHIIINMENEDYFSFSENGLITEAYNMVNSTEAYM